MSLPKPLLRYGGFALSVGGARLVGNLITALTFPFLVRRLGVEVYGLWSYVVVVCAFIDAVANPGLTTYTVQQVAARRQAAVELVSDVLMLRLLASIAAVGVVLIVAVFEVRSDVRFLFRSYGVGLFFVNLLGADYLLEAMELFHVRSLLTVVQQSLYAMGIFLFVRSPKDVIWIACSILGSCALTNLVGWAVLRRAGLFPRLVFAPRRWRGILFPSFHYAAATLMSNFYHRTGHLAVRWFLGEYALGLYAAAVRFVDLLRHFAGIVLGVLMPRMALSADSPSGLQRLTRFAASAIALLSIPLTLGTMTTAKLVVPWVLGRAYVDSVSLVRWMAPFLLTSLAAGLFSGTVLYALGKHRAYLISTVAGALTAVFLYLTLTPLFGLLGAGVAFVLGELGVAVAAYSLIPRYLRGVWKNPVVGVAALATIVMVIAIGFANAHSSRPMVVVGVGSTVYLAAFLTMGGRFFWKELRPRS